MTNTKRRMLQAVGVGMFLGVAAGTVANGNQFGAVTYVLAVAGLALWLVMTFAVHPRAES
jgi:Na+-translocating ferredoxin:NAD+ oxidoreductase RnfA subunit